MLKNLEASLRDVVLSSVAFAVGAVALDPGVGKIGVNVLATAGWAALRFGIGQLAVALQKRSA